MSARGVHVVHTIANGRIAGMSVCYSHTHHSSLITHTHTHVMCSLTQICLDASADTPEVQSGKHIAAEAVGETYLYLHNQHPTLW